MNNFISTMALMFEETAEQTNWTWVSTIVSAIEQVLWPILIIVSAAGLLYAVVIGVNMARADSTEKREEEKKRLFNVILALAITVALILFFELFIHTILPALLPGLEQDVGL